MSVLEIYCEQIRDLLSANVGGERLDIRQGEHGNYVPNLTVVPVTEMKEVIELLNLLLSLWKVGSGLNITYFHRYALVLFLIKKSS